MTHLFDTNPASRHLVISRRVPGVVGSKNLVTNGRFENRGSFWSEAVGSDVVASIDENDPISGFVSLNMTVLTSGNIGYTRQTKSSTEFDAVSSDLTNASNDGNLKLISVKEGDILRLSARAEMTLNEVIFPSIWLYDQVKNLVDVESPLLFDGTILPDGTLVTRMSMFVIPAGIFFINLSVAAFGEFPVNPAGRRIDNYEVHKIGSADELIKNRNFEDSGEFWSKGTAGSASIESINPLTGGKSLKIVSSSTGNVVVYQTSLGSSLLTNADRFAIPVKPGQVWNFSSTAKAQADHDCQFFAIPVDEDGNGIGQPSKLLTTHSGLEITTEEGFYEIPSGVNFIAVQMEVATDPSGPRNYFFDELSMKLAESTTTERLDETRIVNGYWTSPQLNRGGDMTHRLVKLFFLYSCAEDCTAEIELTSDGGRSWTNPRIVQFTRTSDSVRQKLIGQQVTGHDIRFRINFNNKLISFYGYRAEMYPAGHLVDIGE